MKITIDKDKCIGCGACTALASKTFRLADDGKAEAIEPAKDKEEEIKNAAESCPVEAIKIKS